jgi:hypothetical protein
MKTLLGGKTVATLYNYREETKYKNVSQTVKTGDIDFF